MRILIACLVVAGLSACQSAESFSEKVDGYSFSWWGGTVFSNPDQVTMKEVHLDSGGLLGREVIVEGTIVNVGAYFSHMVVTDNTARMLVVLTNYLPADSVLKGSKTEAVRVLGTVERGKKGLPFIMARSLNKVASPPDA